MSEDRAPLSDLTISWSPSYHAEWDNDPGSYLTTGIVSWGRTRRLARIDDPRLALKGYLGVRHTDPGQWNLHGEPEARFFLSLFLGGRTLSLHTYPTMRAALDALYEAHTLLTQQRRMREQGSPGLP